MRIERERLRPYLKWGVCGAVVGTAVLLFVAAVQQPGFPGNVVWTSTLGNMALVGAAVGFFAGGFLMLALQASDRSQADVQKRMAAERRDPKVVMQLYLDIQAGEEPEAWHAVGLLANYRDPEITKRMLEVVDRRLRNKNALIMDRWAFVRHAVKCVEATGLQSNIEQLRRYASDDDSEIGIVIRRLRQDVKEFSLK